MAFRRWRNVKRCNAAVWKCFRFSNDAPLQKTDVAYTDEEQTDYVRKLAGMANNVNQIAHEAHLGGLFSLEDKCKEVLNLITTLIIRIFKGGDLSKA